MHEKKNEILPDKRTIQLIRILSKAESPMSGEKLAEQLEISSRTLRDDIKRIKTSLEKNGARLTAKPRSGYELTVINEQLWHDYIKSLMKYEQDEQILLPVYPEDREIYLMKLFLTTDSGLKIDDLAAQIYVARSTLANDIKNIRKRFEYFHLELQSVPGKGLFLQGSELNKRSCLANYFFYTQTNDFNYLNRTLENQQQETIREILYDVIKEEHMKLTDMGFHNLVIHLYITLSRYSRTEQDCSQYAELKSKKEFKIAQKICSRLSQEFHIQLPEIEIYYITIHLLGKKAVDASEVVHASKENQELLREIFDNIQSHYSYDFSQDLDLYSQLLMHFQPMISRLKYGLFVQNPLLDQIKRENPLGMEMAILAAQTIKKRLSLTLDESEIGYLALHFSLAVEKTRTQSRKYRLLVVCASGAGSSQILSYKLHQQFKNSIESIKVCSLYDLSTEDYSHYDLLLSTVPVEKEIPIPTLQVDYFLSAKDSSSIRDFLANDYPVEEVIQTFFSPNLFFSDILGRTKEEVLSAIFMKIKPTLSLPDIFLESTLEREKIAATSFGNGVALPHPIVACAPVDFCCVACLPHPIQWGEHKVKFIFWLGLASNHDEKSQILNQILAEIVDNQPLLDQLEQDFSFEAFKNLTTVVEKPQSLDDLFSD